MFPDNSFLKKVYNDLEYRVLQVVMKKKYFLFLESLLGSSSWFVGNAMSMANVAIVTQLLVLEMADVVLSFSTYPKLTFLLERARQRRSFQSILLG